jgi:predicted small secreted protein
MTKKGFLFLIAIALILASCFNGSYGQGLEAKVAGAKLPMPFHYHSAVYDGNDFVYIFGR